MLGQKKILNVGTTDLFYFADSDKSGSADFFHVYLELT